MYFYNKIIIPLQKNASNSNLFPQLNSTMGSLSLSQGSSLAEALDIRNTTLTRNSFNKFDRLPNIGQNATGFNITSQAASSRAQ